MWFENAIFPDFYGIVMFGNEKWYTDKLEDLGLTQTTNWENFVKTKIGDLEKWIEESEKDYCTVCNYKYKYKL